MANRRVYNTASIYDFIAKQYRARGSLTLRTIQSAFKIKSLATVYYHLQLLESWGLIEREPYRANMIRLTELTDADARNVLRMREIEIEIQRLQARERKRRKRVRLY